MAKLTKPQLAMLTAVVLQTNSTEIESEMTFLYVSTKNNKPLVALLKEKLVIINKAVENDAGEVACRATDKGLALINGEVEEPPVVEEQSDLPKVEEKPVVKPTITGNAFEIETGVEVPKVKRGGKGRSKYPFEVMEVDQSFHVPVTEGNEEPWKSMASVVSSATRRFKTEEGEVTRKFVVRPAAEDDVKGQGARIFRIK